MANQRQALNLWRDSVNAEGDVDETNSSRWVKGGEPQLRRCQGWHASIQQTETRKEGQLYVCGH